MTLPCEMGNRAFQQGTATPSAFGLRQAERSEKMLDEIGILQILVLSGPQT